MSCPLAILVGGLMDRTLARFLPSDLPAGRVVRCLGLVSDTHMPERCPTLPTALFDILRGVDLVLHAGDVGELWVLDRLSAIAPVVAVHGNDDTAEAQRELPYQQVVALAGRRVLLCHSHYPDEAEELASRRDDAWGPKLDRRAALGRRAGAAVVVFGHTHIPMAVRHRDVLLVNPGALASGSPLGRQRVRTVALLFVRDDGNPIVVHVDIAAPERLFSPRGVGRHQRLDPQPRPGGQVDAPGAPCPCVDACTAALSIAAPGLSLLERRAPGRHARRPPRRRAAGDEHPRGQASGHRSHTTERRL